MALKIKKNHFLIKIKLFFNKKEYKFFTKKKKITFIKKKKIIFNFYSYLMKIIYHINEKLFIILSYYLLFVGSRSFSLECKILIINANSNFFISLLFFFKKSDA